MKFLSHKKRFKLFLLLGLAAGAAQAQTYTWKNVTFPAGGFVSGIEFSPIESGLVYCRTDIGGVYRWDGTNSVWIPLNDMFGSSQYNNYGGESLAPDPVNANIVYMASGMYTASGNGVMLRSTDQGNTWTSNSIAVPMGGNNDGRNAGERLAVDPNNDAILFFGSRSNGLWKSTNSASTWAQVTAFPTTGNAGYGLNFVIIDKRGGTASGSVSIYVGVSSTAAGTNLYRSTNGGTSWAELTGGPTGLIPTHADLGSDGNLYGTFNNAAGPNGITTGQVWKYNTGTGAWTNISPANPVSGAGGFGSVSVDAQNAQHVVVSTLDWWGGPDHIYGSTNGGSAWTVIGNANAGWNAAPFANYNNNGAFWTRFCGTNDGGVGWQGDVRIDPFNSAHAIYTTGGGVWDSSNITTGTQPAGVTWTFMDYGLEETAVIDMTTSAAGGIFFSAVGDIAGMRHTDVTKSPTGGMYCNPTFNDTDGIDFAELNTNIVARVGRDGNNQYGSYSTDNGQSWTPFSANATGTSNGNGNGQIAVAADGSIFLWAPPGNPVVRSTNNGGSWANCTGVPNGAQIASDRVNKNIFFATSGTTLYVSTNGGSSFASAGTFTGSGRPRAVFGVQGEVWVPAGGSGLYRFTNVGVGTVTTTHIANVSSAVALGFGKEASGQTHPAAYLVGTVSGTYGFFRCDDGVGTTWTRINDANHQFGYAGFAGGDETVYGRMYIGTNGRGILYGDLVSGPTATPTKTNTPAATSTFTPTKTSTPTSTATSSPTRTNSPTGTPTFTPTKTNTPSMTPTSTATQTLTKTNTSSSTPTFTATKTNTPANTSTFTQTVTSTPTKTSTPTSTATSTPTKTNTATSTSTFTATKTDTPANTATFTQTVTSTPSSTPTKTNTPSVTPIFTATATQTSTKTNTPANTFTSTSTTTSTFTSTPTKTNTSSVTPTFTATATQTSTKTNTPSSTPTPTSTKTNTPVNTATATSSFTPTATSQFTLTHTPSPTSSSTPMNTATATASFTPTATSQFTLTHTLSPTPSSTGTNTPSVTATTSKTNTPMDTATSTATFTLTRTNSPTQTSSPTETYTGTQPPTLTETFTGTSTNTPMFTSTATSSFTPSPTPSFTAIFTGTATNTAMFTSTPSSTATPQPVVSFQQQSSSYTINPGQTLTYTLTINVTGFSSFSPMVTDNLPSNVTFGNFTGGPTGTLNGNQLTWTLSNLPMGTTTLSFTVTVDGSTPNGFTISNQAFLIYGSAVAITVPANSADVTVIVLTPTPVSTETFTATPTFTAPPTSTNTPTETMTPTVTVTPTFTVGSTVPVLYPNPVSGTTAMIYVPGSGDVTVQVFTTAFRMVESEQEKVPPSGIITLDLTAGGAPLANGLYYVVVTTSKARTVLKMIILR